MVNLSFRSPQHNTAIVWQCTYLLFFIHCHFQEQQYAKWMAAFRLASKGKTMADSSYDTEVQSILSFLSMQQPTGQHSNGPVDPNHTNFQPEDFVASKYMRKLKSKQVTKYGWLQPWPRWLGPIITYSYKKFLRCKGTLFLHVHI